MKAKYKHTNIIARDWKRLSVFYENVFGCKRLPPERKLSGKWLEQGTGVVDAKFSGIHLLLPGCDNIGPTIEIYEYETNAEKMPPAANREGLSHIAFEVDDVKKALEEIKLHGGKELGKITSNEVDGAGFLTFVYALDPEGNIIELQNWKKTA